MRKRGHRLLALGLAALLAFQTPVTVAAENEVQTETVAEEGQETQQVQETDHRLRAGKSARGTGTGRIQNTQKIFGKRDREQTSYTWKLRPRYWMAVMVCG